MYVLTLARKPLDQPTVAANVLTLGVGALAIDAARVGASFVSAGGNNFDAWRSGEGRQDRPERHASPSRKLQSGRWPSNLLLTAPSAVADLDRQSGAAGRYFWKLGQVF